MKRALGPLVAGVIPFNGAPALAANTGLIDERLMDGLRGIAGVAGEPGPLLGSEDELLADTGLQLPSEARRGLLAVIGLPGIRVAVELAQVQTDRRRVDADAARALRCRRRCSSRSTAWCSEPTRSRPRRGRGARAAVVSRAGTRVCPRQGPRRRASSRECTCSSSSRPSSGASPTGSRFPSELLAGLERLVTGRTPARRLGLEESAQPADLAEAALEQFRVWKMFENGGQASPAAQRIAETVTRSLQLIAKELQPGDRRYSPAQLPAGHRVAYAWGRLGRWDGVRHRGV